MMLKAAAKKPDLARYPGEESFQHADASARIPVAPITADHAVSLSLVVPAYKETSRCEWAAL